MYKECLGEDGGLIVLPCSRTIRPDGGERTVGAGEVTFAFSFENTVDHFLRWLSRGIGFGLLWLKSPLF